MSNILLTLLDNLVGSGVSGVQLLLSGNTGDMVIAFIAIAIVGAVIGWFFYLKSKTNRQEG